MSSTIIKCILGIKRIGKLGSSFIGNSNGLAKRMALEGSPHASITI
jgi:hypothetical protein